MSTAATKAPPLLTVQDVAERLKVSRSCAYEIVAGLPGRVLVGPGGRAVRVTEATLDAYIKRGGSR